MRLCQRSSALGLFTLLCGAACASGPSPKPTTASTPQAFIEEQLISPGKAELNTPTSDGGMLYHAEFNAANRHALHVPFDLLKRHCEDQAGRWVPSGKARTSAASLATSKAPNDLVAALADADSRGFFGKFRCESAGAIWTASLEPSAFTPTDASDAWRLQVFVKAVMGSDLSTADEWPVAGPPPLAASASGVTPSATTGIGVPADSQPGATPPSSPLNPQPLHPPAQSDQLLADPRPFGLNMGTDSPDVMASKLKLDAGQACATAAATPAPVSGKKTRAKPSANSPSANDPSPNDPSANRPSASGPGPSDVLELCWEHPNASEALALRARFADRRTDPVLAELEVRYPAASFTWLEHGWRNQWGPADDAQESRTLTRSWTWQHTTVTVSHLADDPAQDTIVRIQHKPSLDRLQLAAGARGREQPGPVRIATPWQLQLGYEPAELAQAKLQAVGFSIARGSCTDGGPHSRPILTRSCRLQGGKMDGLRDANVEIVDPGDGRPRLAQLAYTFDKRVLEDTKAELRSQYGEPMTNANGSLEWWTGPVGIVITPAADTFTLRYFHGRLLQYAYNAREKNRATDKAIQRQGL
jgi:hypothetical protein